MKFMCSYCGYVYSGNSFSPSVCYICKTESRKFLRQDVRNLTFNDKNETPISEEFFQNLKINFEKECENVGIYLAMSRQAKREGYLEISLAFEKMAFKEAYYASKFAEILNRSLFDNTMENLEFIINAGNFFSKSRLDFINKAKNYELNSICELVYNISKDEIFYQRMFLRLLQYYFK